MLSMKRNCRQSRIACFVKPNNQFEFGISKVKSADELPIAIEVAYKEDNEIIIESS